MASDVFVLNKNKKTNKNKYIYKKNRINWTEVRGVVGFAFVLNTSCWTPCLTSALLVITVKGLSCSYYFPCNASIKKNLIGLCWYVFSKMYTTSKKQLKIIFCCHGTVRTWHLVDISGVPVVTYIAIFIYSTYLFSLNHKWERNEERSYLLWSSG